MRQLFMLTIVTAILRGIGTKNYATLVNKHLLCLGEYSLQIGEYSLH